MQRSVQVAFALVVLQAVQIGGQYYSKCNSNADTKRKMVNLIDPNALSCPSSFFDDDKRYCCLRNFQSMNSFECCDAKTFIEQTSIGFVLPLLVSMIVAMMIICCVCCMCCPCCFWYKRRNRGAVYNTVTQQQQQNADAPPVPQHGPNSSVYQQQQQYPSYPQQYGYQPPPYPMMPQQNYPMMNPQDAYPPAVPPHAAPYPPAVPPHAQPMPPPYSESKQDQMYTRQAPFNPNF